MEKIYTAQEIAEQLKIKKTTVYDLIKRGELQATKVGKQLRISQGQLDAYLGLSRDPKAAILKAAEPSPMRRSFDSAILQMDYLNNNNGLIISSQESLMVDLLRSYLPAEPQEYPMLHSYQNCYNSLYSLYWGKAHMAIAILPHHRDRLPDYTLIRGLLPGSSMALLTLCEVPLGFYVRKGNPQGISSISSLSRKEVRMINRERGNECRILLDHLLKEQGISPEDIPGYEEEAISHLSMANAVLSGKADVGIGDLSHLISFPQLEGIPLRTGTMTAIFPASLADHPAVVQICQAVQSFTFREALGGFSGYDSEHSGELVYL